MEQNSYEGLSGNYSRPGLISPELGATLIQQAEDLITKRKLNS